MFPDPLFGSRMPLRRLDTLHLVNCRSFAKDLIALIKHHEPKLSSCTLIDIDLCEGNEEDVRNLVQTLRAQPGLQDVDLIDLLANGRPVHFDHWTISQSEPDEEEEDYIEVDVTAGIMENEAEIQLGTAQMLSSIRIEN